MFVCILMYLGSRLYFNQRDIRYHASAGLNTFAMSPGKFVVGFALAGGLMATLQGCGGGGGSTTPAPGPPGPTTPGNPF